MAARVHNIAEFDRADVTRRTARGRQARLYQFPAPAAKRATPWLPGLRFALEVELGGGLLLFTLWWLWHLGH